MQKIPFTKPLLPNIKKYHEILANIWKNHQLTNHGEYSKKLWQALAAHTQQKNFTLTSSGTMALIVAIKTLELTGEIITTPFVFPAVPHAISFCGLKPVFCDVDLATGNITPENIQKVITPKTSGILAVHTFGNPCAIQKIQNLAQKYKLKVIYDAAPAFDVNYKNKNIVSYGDASIHSYHATKIFHTIEGGAVFFRSKKHMLIAEQIREFGFNNKKSKIMRIGLNAKMSEFHAAMGLAILPLVAQEITQRQDIWDKYTEKLQKLSCITCPNKTQNAQTYTIRIHHNKRNYIHQKLNKKNILTKKYYETLASQYPHYQKNTNKTVPNATLLANEALVLPMHGALTQENINYITSCIFSLF